VWCALFYDLHPIKKVSIYLLQIAVNPCQGVRPLPLLALGLQMMAKASSQNTSSARLLLALACARRSQSDYFKVLLVYVNSSQSAKLYEIIT